MLLTGNSHTKEMLTQQRMYDMLEARHSRVIAGEIARAMRKAGSTIGQPLYLEEAMAEHRVRIEKRLNSLWTQAIKGMVEHISGQTVKEIEPTPLAARIAADWVLSWGGEKITQIVNTTREDVQGIIELGIQDGKTEFELASMIRSVAPMKSMARAATIARTETAAASQFSAFFTAKEANFTMKKRWLASDGDRTRPSHQEADGQVVAMDEHFTVGGEKLFFPADPSGSAKEVINCRCVCAYEVDDGN